MKKWIIYKTTCITNNKIYIGQHKTDNINDGYIGSGKLISSAIKKYGKDKPEDALKTLQSFCSESNVIKSKDVLKLKQLFADGKYGIFLGKFDNYYITNYNKIYDTDVEKTYYEVDVKLEAPYNTMIYNSIQFDEMYYPENSGDPCYIYYRWIFVKTDDKYMIDGCYLLHK